MKSYLEIISKDETFALCEVEMIPMKEMSLLFFTTRAELLESARGILKKNQREEHLNKEESLQFKHCIGGGYYPPPFA